MNRSSTALLLFTFVFLFKATAQPTVQIDNIKDFSFGNLQAVTDSTGVAGYSCCYEADDHASNGKKYQVKFFDKALKETATWAFICSNKEDLLATAYNGSDFMTLILDSKKRILYHKVYNVVSKKEVLSEDKLDANSLFYLEKHLPSDLNLPRVTKLLYTFKDTDFLSIIPTKHDNVFTYDVNIFSKSNGYQKVFFTPETNTKMQQASFVGATDDLLLFYVFSKKDLTNSKYESRLVGIKTETGKKQFEVSTKEGELPYLPLKVAYLPGQKDFTVLGKYFKENDRVKSTGFEGLCLLRMNETGEVVASNTLNWKENFGGEKATPETTAEDDEENSNDSSTQKIKRFQVQGFTQLSNGNLYISGEAYRYHTPVGLTATRFILGTAGGIAGSLAASAMPHNPFMVADLVLLHANKDLKIEGINRFGKKEHYATEFDTDFCINLPTQDQFVVGYRDYNLGKVKEEFSQKLLICRHGNPTIAQGNILTKAINYQLLPASGNEVLLVEYFARKNQAVFIMKTLQ